MFTNTDYLFQKINAIRDLQKQKNFIPEKQLLNIREREFRQKEKLEKRAEKERRQQEARERKAAEKRAKDIFEARKIQRLEDQRIIDAMKSDRPTRRSETVLPTRKLNLEELIPVRVNHKTVIYVKPGSDIEALKLKYKHL